MIRSGVAYCPCCYHILLWDRQGNFYWCNCAGWFFYPREDKAKTRRQAEMYDYRSLTKEKLYD